MKIEKSFFVRNKLQIIIPIIYLIITLPLAEILNIWVDESYSLLTISGSVLDTIKRALYFENQPPVYFTILHIWNSIFSSIFFNRLLSILFILLAIFPINKVLTKISCKNSIGIYQILFFLNPITIYMALEIRPYSLVVLLSSIALYYFFRIYIWHERKKYDKVIFTIVALLSFGTQYYIAFLFASLFLVLIFTDKLEAKLFLKNLFIPTILFLIYISFFLLNQIDSQVTGNSGSASTIESIKEFSINLFCIIVPIKNILISDKRIILFALLILFQIVLHFRYFKKIKDKNYIRIIGMILGLNILILLVLYIISNGDLIHQRHFAYLFPVIFIVVVLLIRTSSQKHIRNSWILILILLYSYNLYTNFGSGYKHYDLKSVSAYLKKINHDADAIVVYRNELALPFEYYYNGELKVIALPKSISPDEKYDLHDWAYKNIFQVQKSFNNLPAKIIYITDLRTKLQNVDFKPELIEKYIRENCSVRDSVKIENIIIRKIEQSKNVL